MITKQLFNNQQTWIKRDSGLFDVTMAAHDGAKACELVGNYLLYELSKLYQKKDIGVYRENGLVVFKNECGPVKWTLPISNQFFTEFSLMTHFYSFEQKIMLKSLKIISTSNIKT